MNSILQQIERLYDAYIFDLDGTIYIGDALLPSVEETLATLRRRGARTVFLSNNATRTPIDYAAKLTRLGIPANPSEIITAGVVLRDFLQQELPGARLFVIGELSLQNFLREAGFTLVDTEVNVDAVIAGFDRAFTYEKLRVAFNAIRAGARFFATNPDPFCPAPNGPLPDAAAMTAAIEACTGKRVELIAGKPSNLMGKTVLESLNLPASRCLIVGDRLETDIRMGEVLGMDTALVLTGATSLENLGQTGAQPTYVLKELSALLPT